MATIDDNINRLFEFASAAIGNARSAEGRLAAVNVSTNVPNLNYKVGQPNMPLPTSLGELLSPDNSSTTIKFLDAESEKWLDKFFPEIQACLRTSPEEWLCGIITGQKPFGMSREVFEAVWHEGRDREYRARNSAVRQLHSEFSARGFSLPVGAHVAAITKAEEAASDAIGQVNRQQMTEDARIKLDLLKFAEEQAIRLKLGVLQAMADFYRQWIELPNKDLEASRIKTQAYATFQDALSSYYRVQLGFEELRLQAASLEHSGKIDSNRLKVDAARTWDSRNAALGQAVQAYGDVAAAAASAASTLTANVVTGTGT